MLTGSGDGFANECLIAGNRELGPTGHLVLGSDGGVQPCREESVPQIRVGADKASEIHS